MYFDSDFRLEHFSIDTIANLTHDSGRASDIYGEGKPEYMAFTLGYQGLNITTGAHYFYILCNLPSDYMYSLRGYCLDRIGELTKDEFEKLVLTPSALGKDWGEYMLEDIAGYPVIAYEGAENEMIKPRCFMTNVTSPAPYYLAPYTIMPDGGSFPAVNGFTMTIGKAFAKVSVAYVEEEAGQRLSDVQWRIVNDPKHTYMLPNIFKGQVHTPHYDADPTGNFDDYFEKYFNPNSHISKNILLPDSTNFSWRTATTKTTIEENENKNHAYCFENGNKTVLQGNSTMVLVKAKYIPEQWLNPDDSPGNETLDGTFWRIKNNNGKYLSGYYNAEPGVGSSQEAIKYENGITYYPIWLETDGRYMVERNHFYKIAITDVLSAGAPDLDNVMDPMEPLVYSSTDTKSADSGKNLPETATSIRWKQKN
ncbi:MAG: hypothetical protein LUE98_21275 [Tannerellaceae bacterium]|nr:hypothetical protein [Tannerellaceae bacterium]